VLRGESFQFYTAKTKAGKATSTKKRAKEGKSIFFKVKTKNKPSSKNIIKMALKINKTALTVG